MKVDLYYVQGRTSTMHNEKQALQDSSPILVVGTYDMHRVRDRHRGQNQAAAGCRTNIHLSPTFCILPPGPPPPDVGEAADASA